MADLQAFSVGFEYPVHFTADALDPAEPALAHVLGRKEPARRHRVLFVVDDGVACAHPGLSGRVLAYASAHSARMTLAGDLVVVPGGEAVKNDPAHLKTMLDRMHELALDRHAFVVVLGGGAVLDMVGYAAAITHRGVRVVRLPTTVLSQADSGVGVKNGVNAYGKKNYLGTFAPPFAVINDARLLSTLPARDRVAGMAEALKVALVCDAAFFAWMSERADGLRRGDALAMDELVQRSCTLHLAHIATSGDPFELGSVRPLDFGHWSAHKLEVLTDHRLRHGEAVAIGMALDTLSSVQTGVAEAHHGELVLSVLARLGLPLWDDALDHPALLEGLDEFREHLGGELTISMLERPGRVVEVHQMPHDVVRSSIDALRARARIARELRPIAPLQP